MRRLVGLDIETYDPYLKGGKSAVVNEDDSTEARGYSWKYDVGYILITALYYFDEDRLAFVKGKNLCFDQSDAAAGYREIKNLLLDPDVSIVGANLQYDIGWLLYELGLTVYDIKCSFIDVLSAEAMLNEFKAHSLDSLAKQYLGIGKTKTAVEAYVKEHISKVGDFRQHLKDVPYQMLIEYVAGDAKLPCLIWQKQLPKLVAEKLQKRTKLEFDCILPTLAMTINGFPVNKEQKDRNREYLENIVAKFEADFKEKYGELNINSPKQMGAFLEKQGIPFAYRITLKTLNGVAIADMSSQDERRAFNLAKNLEGSTQFVKGKICAFVLNSFADRVCSILSEQGFTFTCNPNCDHKWLEANRDNYELLGLISDWKMAKGILSKILGSRYDRFIHLDKDGVYRIHSQYTISKSENGGAISSRYSSSYPNNQQIPSKNGLVLSDGTKVSFPDLTRALFTCEKGGVYFKIDYSQVEYRLLVDCAVGEGAEEARAMFQKDKHTDFHQYTVDLTGLTRKYAKNLSFGISYGMGVKSMAKNFGWTEEHAQELYDQYTAHLPFVLPTLQLLGDLGKQRGYIRTLGGAKARLQSESKAYTMLNRRNQGSGADILKAAIVRAFREGVWHDLKIHDTVHDELGGTVYPTVEQVKRVIQLEDIMENTLTCRVPLLAEAEFGMNWQDVKEPKEWLEMKEKEPEKWEALPSELRYVVETYAELKGLK
jgi:DNA polymerase I-like protein with 3'-5' exonuclease and polymerase domains